MANRGLVPAHNQQHDVPALVAAGKSSLRALARAYFVTEVAGQAPSAIDAKRRDLGRFLAFYAKLYGHDRPGEWHASVTREFLRTDRTRGSYRSDSRAASPSHVKTRKLLREFPA